MSDPEPPLDRAVAVADGGGGVRVAIEGCAHGALHAIYASVEESCRVRGWKGVDLVIIGGDFQAVRNQYDLNVTSMPEKYRRMADFHEYYSGARTAPYLTIFIGGNHEASNHLFELYYGGWVAPNIYYLGAANVIRFGPLRIAGLSGIWKGYDYSKPHFERLPYNREETSSIYHVRELDARKLLSIRSQVDIGLSHDWPHRVELHGDSEWLFRTKQGFATDSQSGKLGNPAARECLDWLRPPYWFSAHLHTRYPAIVHHDQDNASLPKSTPSPQRLQSPNQHTTKKARGQRMSPASSASSTFGHGMHALPRPNVQRVSAWQQFGMSVQAEDAAEREKILQEREEKRREEERTGIRSTPQYTFNETFRQLGPGREIVSETQYEVKSDDDGDHINRIPNLDGCCNSRPMKRQRADSDPRAPVPIQHSSTGGFVYSRGDQLDGAQVSVPAAPAAPAAPGVAIDNPDQIDIEMSSDDDVPVAIGRNSTSTTRSAPVAIPQGASGDGAAAQDTGGKNGVFSMSTSAGSEDGGVKLDDHATSPPPELPVAASDQSTSKTFESSTALPVISESAEIRKSTEAPNSLLDPSAPSFAPTPTGPRNTAMMDISPHPIVTAVPKPEPPSGGKSTEVSEEMRAQLAALSSTFTKKEKETKTSPDLPFPSEISNKTTEFLALGKCEPFQEFLQLKEIRSISSPNEEITRPLKLSYDPEWLAIQRVFAPELALGGSPTDKGPPHRGATYYRDQIVKEQEWIEENVVKPGKLQVPENFTITAPVYDPKLTIPPNATPREVTNPQTSAYCELIGIENKFDISEQERQHRMEQGPRPDRPEYLAYESRASRNRQGGGRGRGGGGGGGRGRGGGGGNRGRGRGGRW